MSEQIIVRTSSTRVGLSKSQLTAHRQCEKRLWLQRNQPELKQDSASALSIMATGNEVGELARELFPNGVLIEAGSLNEAIVLTQQALQAKPSKPIYEATFEYDGLLVRVDVLVPDGKNTYRLIEVKSSTSVKEYHHDDVAIQAYVLLQAGIKLSRIEVAVIDNSFVYQGKGDYSGLLKYEDLTEQTLTLQASVKDWVKSAQKTIRGKEPEIAPGKHCSHPFECPFSQHCAPFDDKAYPITILPKISKKLTQQIKDDGYDDIRDIPKNYLDNTTYDVIRQVTKSGKPYIAHESLRGALEGLPYPHYFIDFETINPAIPLWEGTRPYQQVPFQWSCHVKKQDGSLSHMAFLAQTKQDPRREFAETLIRAVKRRGTIVVYNKAFEETRLRELARDFGDLSDDLNDIIKRLYDLLPLARENYYHRDMRGSWSIKAVLPTIAPELRYENLAVSDGGMAQQAFAEMLKEETTDAVRQEMVTSLLQYCERDTLAMVRIFDFFRQG